MKIFLRFIGDPMGYCVSRDDLGGNHPNPHGQPQWLSAELGWTGTFAFVDASKAYSVQEVEEPEWHRSADPLRKELTAWRD